jgi:peptidyl-prolyl cis-trans isomerase SurA
MTLASSIPAVSPASVCRITPARRARSLSAAARLIAVAGLFFTLCFLALPKPAAAQVAALVNNEPITAVDIAQRTRLHEVFNRKRPSRQEILDELINEKIKLATARKMNVDVSDSKVDSRISDMAGPRGVSGFMAAIEKEGIERTRFRSRIRAEIAWREVLLQASPGTFQVRDADLVAILNAHGEKPVARGMQYTLQPIIFVVSRRAPDSAKAARLKEAEAFRSRVQGCEEAAAQARTIRETVVKPQIKKFSLDLGTQYRKLLDSTPDGKMTPAEITGAGMEVVMVCSRQEVMADISSRKEFRQELLNRRISEFEKEYLAKLRTQFVIQIR